MTDIEITLMKTAMKMLHLLCDSSKGCGDCPFMKYCHVMDYETPSPDKWEV